MTAAAKKTPETAEDRKRKRRRNVAIGTGIGMAVLSGVLLFARNASADSKRLKAPPKKPRGRDDGASSGGSSGGGSRRTSPDSGGDGGSRGPGGGGSTDGGGDSPTRTTPDGGSGGDRTPPRRTTPEGTTPTGPDPTIDELPYNSENPDPGTFYQVTAGGEDAKGLLNIARRYALTSLFLAARNVGELDDDGARNWASENAPDAEKLREWADYILCVAWNDVLYGSFRVSANNRRGPHGRGIPLSPMHADNWQRLLEGRNPLRNVRLHSAGEVGTPSNVGRGDQRLPLLWMPQLDEQVLWDSRGATLRAGGTWANGFSFYFPPPIVMARSINDPTDASLGAWGCGEGRATYG